MYGTSLLISITFTHHRIPFPQLKIKSNNMKVICLNCSCITVCRAGWQFLPRMCSCWGNACKERAFVLPRASSGAAPTANTEPPQLGGFNTFLPRSSLPAFSTGTLAGSPWLALLLWTLTAAQGQMAKLGTVTYQGHRSTLPHETFSRARFHLQEYTVHCAHS